MRVGYEWKKRHDRTVKGLSVKNALGGMAEKKQTITSSDTQNREYVRQRIIELSKEGLSKEKILEILLQDPIISEFNYFTKQGIDIKNIFISWIESHYNKSNNSNNKEK